MSVDNTGAIGLKQLRFGPVWENEIAGEKTFVWVLFNGREHIDLDCPIPLVSTLSELVLEVK